MTSIETKLNRLQSVIRYSLAFVWLYTAVISVLFSHTQGFPLLKKVGVTLAWQPVLLYGGAALDACLGILILSCWQIRLIGFVQVFLILVYTVIASVLIPDFWVHPLAPLAKNIPIMAIVWGSIVLNKVKHDL